MSRKIWERGTSPSRNDPVTSRGLGGAPVGDRSKVFDPALKQFRDGLVASDPRFDTPEQSRAWHRLQRRVMGHVLRSIAAGPFASHLVLRGSALMCAWFGEAARPPKDLDFVVVPNSIGIEDPLASAIFEEVVASVTSRPFPDVALRPDEVVMDDIWTYDRVPGNRLVFKWKADDLPWGSTQLDFVFGEAMPLDPESLAVTLDDADPALLRVAPRSLSLAWKISWLYSDMHPRGKDLYDAMLLAEATALPPALLEQVFQLANGEAPPERSVLEWLNSRLEWVGFEEPGEPVVEAWKLRLARALENEDPRT